jgi:hypothetical protein
VCVKVQPCRQDSSIFDKDTRRRSRKKASFSTVFSPDAVTGCLYSSGNACGTRRRGSCCRSTTAEAPAAEEEASAPAASSDGTYTPPEGAMAPVALDEGSQSTNPWRSKRAAKPSCLHAAGDGFNYYMAIGEGIKAKAADLGVEVVHAGAESGADIAGQMKMIQT